MKITRYTLAVCLGLILSALFGSHASAFTITQASVENRGDFVLEPGKVELFVNPGETVTKNISVVSRINQQSSFKVEIEDFIGSKDINNPVILLGEDRSPYSFKDNIKPDTDAFDLTFGQRITIPVTITVPPNAQPGGYYSSVIVANEPKETATSSEQGRTKIISRVGVLFFIRVNGPVNAQGNLDDFRVNGPTKAGVIQRGPLTFDVLFNNSGTIHLIPYGEITIKNTLGKEIGRVPIDAYFSLPNSLRYRQVNWSRETLFGRYTAHIELHRGYGDGVDTRDVTFWIIPWAFIIIILIIAFILACLYYFFFRKFELRRKE